MNTPELETLVNLTWLHGEGMNDHLHANDEVMRIIKECPQERRERSAVYLSTGNKQIHDPLFPTYNANHVHGSNYIAAEGPNDIGLEGRAVHGSMARFLENTLFNQTHPIKLIVAIGQSGNTMKRGDFTNYFAEGLHVFSSTEHAAYQVESRLINNNLSAYLLEVKNPLGKKQTAQLYWLPVSDMQPVTNHPQTIATLAHVHRLACNQLVLIHCAAGVGRTGVVVLMFKILDHYNEIFAENDVKQIARKLRDLLTTIRQIRPGFITTKKQLESAVQCAIDIHHLRTDHG